MRIWKFYILLAFICITRQISAQTYPVQVTIAPVPPFQNSLGYYADEERLKVYLTLVDFTAPAQQVKLKFTITGPNYTFTSSPNNLIYTLNPGQPLLLTTSDLQTFFNTSGQSLNFQENLLTEGFTSICVDVFRIQNNEQLSLNGCGFFDLTYGQPSMPSSPECGSNLNITFDEFNMPNQPTQFMVNPPIAPIGMNTTVQQQIYFYWFPTSISNSPPAIPNQITPYFSDDIPYLATTYIYNPSIATNPLVRGERYVWYTRTSINGSYNQMQNDGWSSPCMFTFGEALTWQDAALEGLHVEWDDAGVNGFTKSGTNRADAKWLTIKDDSTSLISFERYVLSYRKKDSLGSVPREWYHDTLFQTNRPIFQLEPATSYEAYIEGVIGTTVSDPTEIRFITTDSLKEYACDEPGNPNLPAVYQPLSFAEPGMKVNIGQFTLQFTEVTPTSQVGYFEGTGTVPIDFLLGTKVNVQFEDLKIDDQFNVWDGTANVITEGLDAWLEYQYQQFQDPIWVNGVVDSAWVSDSVAYISLNGQDTSFTFPCPSCPVIINDAAGNQITIYANGTIIWGSYLNLSNDYLDASDSKYIQFKSAGVDEKYGTDCYSYIQLSENYELIIGQNSYKYFVTNKSISDEVNDVIVAELSDSILPLLVNGNLKFLQNDELELEYEMITTDSKQVKINLPYSSIDYAVYAYIDTLRLGKLNIYSYFEISKNVHIIPTVEGDFDSIVNDLENSFKSANIKINVTLHNQWNDSIYNESRNILLPSIAEVGLANKYSNDMRELRDSYLAANNDVNLDGYVIFIVPGFNDINANGYMVKGKTMGFVKHNSYDIVRTICHELGHGIGALNHPEKEFGIPQGSSELLMDYGSGKVLTKTDWRELRDRDFMPGLFDETESNESGENSNGKCFYYGLFIHVNGGDTTVSHRTFIGRYDWYKNGPVNAPFEQKLAQHPHAIDKIFIRENGAWVPKYYMPIKKVKYLYQKVNDDFSHNKYINHLSSNMLKVDIYTDEIPANGFYQVKVLYRNGESQRYAHRVYDAYLNEICDYIKKPSGNSASRSYYLNDKWLSDEFLKVYEKRKNKEVTTCYLLSWLENHPLRYNFSQEGIINAVNKFNLNNNDDHYYWENGSGWYGNSIVSNNGDAEKGITIHYVKLGSNGEWIRDSKYISEPSFGASGSGIHRKYGDKNCYHTLNEAMALQSHYEDLTIPNDADQFEALINILLEGNSCKIYDIRKEDKYRIILRALKQDIDIDLKCILFRKLLFYSSNDDFSILISQLKNYVPGTNTMYLRNMFDQVMDASGDLSQSWMKALLIKYKEYYESPNFRSSINYETFTFFTKKEPTVEDGALHLLEAHFVGGNKVYFQYERLYDHYKNNTFTEDGPEGDHEYWWYKFYNVQTESFEIDEPLSLAYGGTLTGTENLFAGTKFNIVPAFLLAYIGEKQEDAEINQYWKIAEITFSIATLPLGVGGILTAVNAGKYGWAIFETAGLVASTYSIIQDSPCLQEAENCPEFGLYNAFSTAFSVFQISKLGYYKLNQGKLLKTTSKNVSEQKSAYDLTNYDKLVKELNTTQRNEIIDAWNKCSGCALKNDPEISKVYQAVLNLEEVVLGAGRVPWNGYTNIFKANTDEILEATNRIKNHRLTAQSGGNYGYIEGTVNNASVDNKFWRSGAVQEGEPQIFTAIQVEGANGGTWLRNTDSEYKMLNKLASDLGGTPNSIKANITGELKIISENPYCASCTGIIQQFHDMFPNVKLILVDGAK